MDQETTVGKEEHRRRGVSLPVLVFAILATVAIVSSVFILQRRRAATATEKLTIPERLTDEQLFKQTVPSVVLIQAFDQSGQMTKTGSGFIAGPDGAVITNYHMIRGAYSEKAIFQDGSSADVLGVLGYSQAQDVAAIRVNASFAKPLALGDSDRVEVGDRVVAIGSPRGLKNTISDGLVSAVRGGIIQTSAPISPGSSGGPFFNERGQVIGVTVATLRDSQNVNFVVPINQAKPYLANSSLTTLSDIASENAVVRPLISSAVSIPPGQNREWNIVIDANRMDDAELQGSFQSSGGINGRIRIFVLDQATNRILYDSQLQTSGTVDVKLQPGAYRLVMSNAASIMFARTVTTDLALHYVR